VGGEAHAYLAAVDAATGMVKPWRADCDSWINTVLASGSTVFAGGQYITTVNGQPRTNLVALDAVTGVVRPWDAHLSGSVATPSPSIDALALSGHTLYVGGDFYSLGGQVRPCLAALDDSVGLATEWAPRPDFPVRSLAISGDTLYAGGIFGAVGLLPSHSLAALSIPMDPAPTTPVFALAQNFPNPAGTATTVRFALPAAAVTTLSIYDVQGRRVTTPIDHSVLQPGEHDVRLKIVGMRPGVYLYRLEAGGMAATRKMLVLG